VPPLWEEERVGAAAVVADLTDVGFIASGGLGALVELHNPPRAQQTAPRRGRPCGSTPAVLLYLAGLRGRLPKFETRRDGLNT
jgi:hypothetical protein